MSFQAPPVKLAKLTPKQARRLSSAGPVRVQAGDASARPQAPRISIRRDLMHAHVHDMHVAVRSTARSAIATPRFAARDRDTLPVSQQIFVPFAANPRFTARIRIAPPPCLAQAWLNCTALQGLALESGPRLRHGLRSQKNGVIPTRRAILIICDFRVLERSSRPGTPDELNEHRNQEQDEHA